MIYYVDPESVGGRAGDRNPGTIAAPLATLRRAHDLSRPGDTIVLRRGVHYPLAGGPWNIRRGGTPNAWITYQAQEGEAVYLYYSERYPWTYDAAGRWWRTTLPTGSAAATYANVGVMVHGGWAASPILDHQQSGRVPPPDFRDPPDAFFDQGKLQYDLTFYDAATRTLYLKSNEVQPLGDPRQQAHIVSSAMQCHIEGPGFVEFRSLRFYHGFFGIHSNAAAAIRVRKCVVKHQFSQGILTMSPAVVIEGNYVDCTGGLITNKLAAGGYRRDWLHHGLYVTGQNSVIRNNFFGRALSGGSAHVCGSLPGEDPNGSVFADNVCYGGASSCFLFNGNGVRVHNNVIVTGPVRWRKRAAKEASWGHALVACPDQTAGLVSGNYIEGINGIVSDLARPPRRVERLTILNNHVHALSGACLLLSGNVSVRAMDGNAWLGGGGFQLQMGRAEPPPVQVRTRDYAEFRTYALGQGWEKSSRTAAAQPPFDMAGYEAYLDGTPDTLKVPADFRQYAAAQGWKNQPVMS